MTITILNLMLINRINYIDRNRKFSEFIGQETFDDFISFLQTENIIFEESEKYFLIPLNKNIEKFKKIVNSIEILISSEKLDKNAKKKRLIDNNLIERYNNCKHQDFFKMLFHIIKKESYLWLEGKESLGLRAAHQFHKTKGVSLVTISFDDIKIQNER